jgi:undecaprenyl-diphosphatase
MTVAASAPEITWWKAIVLGFVQGATEFLPISSSAHLKVVPVLLGWGDPGSSYTAVIQLGSIVAVLAYFRKDLWAVFQGSLRSLRSGDWTSQEGQMAIGIAVGTLPIVLLGLLIKKFVPDYDHSPLRSLGSIAIVSLVMASLLGLAERLARHRRSFGDLRWRDGLLMGIGQAMAIVPGVSRSGATLTAGLALGLERAAAARFSFLLGIPAITLAGLVELKAAFSQPTSAGPLPLLVGVLSAMVVSWLAIAWLLRFLQKHSTWWFVGYRLVFGLALLLGAGRLAATTN